MTILYIWSIGILTCTYFNIGLTPGFFIESIIITTIFSIVEYVIKKEMNSDLVERITKEISEMRNT